jgi:hypothetical protein
VTAVPTSVVRARENLRAAEDKPPPIADRAALKKPTAQSAKAVGLVTSRFDNGNDEGWYTLNRDDTPRATSSMKVDTKVFPQGRNYWLAQVAQIVADFTRKRGRDRQISRFFRSGIGIKSM